MEPSIIHHRIPSNDIQCKMSIKQWNATHYMIKLCSDMRQLKYIIRVIHDVLSHDKYSWNNSSRLETGEIYLE